MLHKGLKITFALLVTCLFVVASGCKMEDLTGQVGAVQGVVKDGSGNPLVSSLVTVQGSSYSALTNVDGRYVLNLPAGSYVLGATRDGFSSETKQVNVSENNGSPVTADFVMGGSTNNGPILYVNLSATEKVYKYGQPIKVKLTIVNRGDEAIEIGGDMVPWEIVAHSEEGWRLWNATGSSCDKCEIAAGETKTFEAKWKWYEHPVNRPVVVMLEGHVNPNFPVILPVDDTNDNRTTGSATGSDEDDNETRTNNATMEATTPYIPGYVTEPLFIRLTPDGIAVPIVDPTDPHIEPHPCMPWPNSTGNGCGQSSPGFDPNGCYVPGNDGTIEPWVFYGEEKEEIVIRPRCWRLTRYRQFYAK